MRQFLFFICFTSLFFFSSLGRADVAIQASISPQQATTEDELQLTITVSGSDKATDPSLPSMPAFGVISTGQMSSIEIINTQMTVKKEYTYTLVPKEAGNFTIDPISVFSGGHEYKSQPLQVKITAAGAPPTSRQAMPYVPGPRNQAEPSGPAVDRDSDVYSDTSNAGRPYWITTEVSNRNPYVNEQIIFTFRLYNAARITGIEPLNWDFKDFTSEMLVPEKKYSQNINGTNYTVLEQSIALFPRQSGSATIDAVNLKIEVPDMRPRGFFDDPFFGLGRSTVKYLKAPSIQLTVSPLPDPQPVDFSNLVGQYQMKTSLSENTVKMGESTTMSVEVFGRGNIKDGILPKTPDPDGFKIYDDKPSVETTLTENGVDGKKIFKRALVPTQAGQTEIPPLSLSYFDPKKGTYEKLSTQSLAVNVNPSESQNLNAVTAQNNTENKQEQPKAPVTEDIASIHTQTALTPVEKYRFSGPWAIALLFFPPLVFLLVWLGQRFYRARQGNGGEHKMRRAYKKLYDSLRKAEITSVSPANKAKNYLDIIREYMGDCFQVVGRALTLAEMVKFLEVRGVSRELSTQFQQIMTTLEMMSYGGGTLQSNSFPRCEQIFDVMSQIDKRIKG